MKVVCRYRLLCLKLVDDNTLPWSALIDAGSVPGDLTLALSGIDGIRRPTGYVRSSLARAGQLRQH
jgi:hypothetical protein